MTWFKMTWLTWLGRRLTSARALCVVLLFALLFLRVTDPQPLEELRLRAFDIFQVIKPRVATLRPVVIVDIDEESLRKLGQFPWPRTRVADLITALTKLGEVRMVPGMPVEAFVQTGDRTMISYLVKPLHDQLMRMFREK